MPSSGKAKRLLLLRPAMVLETPCCFFFCQRVILLLFRRVENFSTSIGALCTCQTHRESSYVSLSSVFHYS